MRKLPTTKAGRAFKMHKVMHEFKYGQLHSGSKKGPLVKARKKAIAIALSEAGLSRKGRRIRRRR